ncbi:MAG: tRNA (adenosine(37)-N6)-threonylcarbamoyltransferase complex dimerization subunit type 1 TsaB, partial [Acidimicrobiales bacterium]
GPGLYTGLRVGLATAGALAQALGIGLVGVTSCELLAHAAATRGVAGSVLAVVDARRGEVFVQRFTLGDGRASALDEPAVARPDEVAPTLDESWTITGDGARRYGDLLCARGSALMNDVVPSPGAALDIGALREGVERVAPLYLRDADAVANFATRERP